MELKLLTRADIPEDAITVSPSQMNMWYKCRYQWKLAKIDLHVPETYKTIGAANLGLIFHKFLQWYYDVSKGRAVGELSEVGQMKAIEYVRQTHGSDKDFYSVYTIFLAYTQWAMQREEMISIGAEIETFAPTGLKSHDGREIWLHGFIDLLAWLFDKLIVTDHKSHTNRPWTRERLFYDHQFPFYCLLLELQGIPVDGVCVNTANLFIPKDHKKFQALYTGEGPKREPRFKRIMLGPKDIKLQFYLDQFLGNIKEMWCQPQPATYPMRLTADCQYCSFRDHIAMDAAGQGEGALAVLKTRFSTEDFELTVGDYEGDEDDEIPALGR